MWLLIDDIRDLNTDAIARTAGAGKALLKAYPWECLCLDHDLGETSETGYQVLLWAINENALPEKVQLVTSNPVGRANMAQTLLANGYRSKDGFNFQK
jgi:hypothetical protein